jgi:hypothetical protein
VCLKEPCDDFYHWRLLRAVSVVPLKGTLSFSLRFPAVETAGYCHTSR